MKKPFRIALYCVLLISVAAIGVLAANIIRQPKLPPVSVITESGVDISGDWYGGPGNQDVLTFHKNGKYESSSWLAGGTFNVEGETVLMMDPYKAEKVFALGEDSLSYTDSGITYTYFRTKQQLPPEPSASESLDYMYLATVNQILQKGKWANTDNAELVITDKAVGADPYSITKITAQDGKYLADLDINKVVHKLTISEAEDGYHLTIQPLLNTEFVAPADFPLEQP